MWKTSAEHGCLAVILAQTFEHTSRTTRVGPDMNLAASFVAYCVSGLSCPTYSAVPTRDQYCCVSCSSKLSAPSRKPLPTVFEPGATVTFHFVCWSCLPLKPHFPTEERHRNVKHSDDHRRVCSLGLVSRSNFRGKIAANVSDLGSPVFTSVAQNRYRIAGLFGSFRVSTQFDQIFFPRCRSF